MAYGPLKRGPQTDDPIDKQFKIRAKQAELDKITELARDGVSLPARVIPAGVSKSDLVRLALGLTDAVPPKGEPGKSALTELQRRLKEGGN
jgi:hypothetical protein